MAESPERELTSQEKLGILKINAVENAFKPDSEIFCLFR